VAWTVLKGDESSRPSRPGEVLPMFSKVGIDVPVELMASA
jgi:hypothetical protein